MLHVFGTKYLSSLILLFRVVILKPQKRGDVFTGIPSTSCLLASCLFRATLIAAISLETQPSFWRMKELYAETSPLFFDEYEMNVPLFLSRLSPHCSMGSDERRFMSTK